jgi:hypothetical protein
MSWLQDFSDGEAVWERLMRASTVMEFAAQRDALSPYELKMLVLFFAIREKQSLGPSARVDGGSHGNVRLMTDDRRPVVEAVVGEIGDSGRMRRRFLLSVA